MWSDAWLHWVSLQLHIRAHGGSLHAPHLDECNIQEGRLLRQHLMQICSYASLLASMRDKRPLRHVCVRSNATSRFHVQKHARADPPARVNLVPDHTASHRDGQASWLHYPEPGVGRKGNKVVFIRRSLGVLQIALFARHKHTSRCCPLCSG